MGNKVYTLYEKRYISHSRGYVLSVESGEYKPDEAKIDLEDNLPAKHNTL